MPSQILNSFKRFLYNHSSVVDFLSASLIISICLIILLPKVHESFQTTSITHHHHHHQQQLPHQADITTQQSELVFSAGPADEILGAPPPNNDTAHVDPHDHDHSHQHNHNLPIGEVIICAGFFVFYCIGLGLSGKLSTHSSGEPLLMAERKVSTVCCSSTRCPSSQPEPPPKGSLANHHDQSAKLNEETIDASYLLNADKEDDCVLLLNRHHNHHTHNRHHEHPIATHGFVAKNKRSDYGSTSRSNTTPDLVKGSWVNRSPPSPPVYVGEIRITRTRPGCDDSEINIAWPLSARITLFGLLLAGSLILFDLNIHGLMEAIKVFRAASTGALLYVAFFLVLPKGPAGCNSCTEEEI